MQPRSISIQYGMPIQQFFDMNADLKGMQEDTPFELDQVTFFLKIEVYIHFLLIDAF